MAALWSGDDEGNRLIVDPTIGQFGGSKRLFIGTVQGWLDELSQLHNGAAAELDPGGSKFIVALMDEQMRAKTAAIHQEQHRSARVSRQSQMADTLKKNQTVLRLRGDVSSCARAFKNGDTVFPTALPRSLFCPIPFS
jgi:hypothetical protein